MSSGEKSGVILKIKKKKTGKYPGRKKKIKRGIQ